MLPHASPPDTDGEGLSIGRIHSERGEYAPRETLPEPNELNFDPRNHYSWTAPDPELTVLHRKAYWKFVSNGYADAEQRLLLDGECLVCHHPVHRIHAVHKGYLVISAWKHEYGAKHPAAVEEN